LRNPSNVGQSIAIDIESAFELPSHAPRRYFATSPWRENRGREGMTFRAGEERRIRLAPFEVLTLEMVAR
jgi:hypothetical protein